MQAHNELDRSHGIDTIVTTDYQLGTIGQEVDALIDDGRGRKIGQK